LTQPSYFRRHSFLAGALASCALPTIARAQSPTHLSIGTAPIDSGMTPIIAQRAGFYRRYGLDMDIQVMNSGAVVSAAVAGGALNVGSSALMGLIAAHIKGIPFQIITPAAGYRSEKPSDVLLVRKDSPIRTGADLNGKIIASPALHDFLAITTLAWIDAHGGDSKTVRQIELPLDATATALMTGRIDAAAMSEPRVSDLLKSGNARALGKPYDVVGNKFLISAFFAQSEAINADKDAFGRLARAHHDANVFANAHPDVTAPWLADFAHLDPVTVGTGQRAYMAESLNVADIQVVIDAAARYKVIEQSFDARDMISPAVLNLRLK